MPEQLIIGYNPMSAANKLAYRGGQIRGRLVWIIVALVFCTWIFLWQRDSLSLTSTLLLFGAGLTYSLIWLTIGIINWARAKAALAAIGPGVAMMVDRGGVWIKGTGLAWPEIARISVATGHFGGSPNLAVRRQDGQSIKVSLADLDTMAGTIDAAVRAYSAGSQKIETAKLGN